MISNLLSHLKIDKGIIFLLFLLFLYLPLVGHADALVYLCFFVLCMLLGCLIDNSESKQMKLLFLCSLLLFTTIFSGFRNFDIGYDIQIYIMEYFNDTYSFSSIKDFIFKEYKGDKLFLALASISRLFSNNPQWYLFCIALFIHLFTFFAVVKINEKEKKINWFVFLFMWFFFFFHESLNIMRQYCAMSILLLSFVFLIDGKWLKSLWLVIPAFLFHSSAIIFLCIFPFYVLSFVKNKKKKKILLSIMILCSLVCVVNIFKILPFLENIGIVSNDYASRYGVYSDYDGMNIFGPSFLVMYSIICYGIWQSYKKGILANHILMLAIGVHSLYFVLRIATFYVQYLNRLSTYFFYCDLLIFSIILSKNIIPKKIKYLFYLCVVYMWYNSFIFYPGAATYPYASLVLGIS